MKSKALPIALAIALAFSLGAAIWLGIANRKMLNNINEHAAQEQVWALRESAYMVQQEKHKAKAKAIQDSLQLLYYQIVDLNQKIKNTQNYEANTRKHVNSLTVDSLLNSIHARYARTNKP